MAIIEGGDIGFDEGGVLQALSQPFITNTVKSFKRNRKGDVIAEDTTTYAVSMTHVVALMVIYYGPRIMGLFNSSLLSDEQKATVFGGFLKAFFPGHEIITGGQVGEMLKHLPPP